MVSLKASFIPFLLYLFSFLVHRTNNCKNIVLQYSILETGRRSNVLSTEDFEVFAMLKIENDVYVQA